MSAELVLQMVSAYFGLGEHCFCAHIHDITRRLKDRMLLCF